MPMVTRLSKGLPSGRPIMRWMPPRQNSRSRGAFFA